MTKMLKWLRTQAGIIRESARYGHPIADIRRRRAIETASLQADADAFGASIADVRMARSGADGVVAIETRFGTLHLRPKDTDLLVMRQVFIDREYDIDSLAQMKAVRTRYEAMVAGGETPVIIDAGANVGAASRWFGARFPDAHIIAVEPDPGNAAVARLNIASLPNATVREAAIGARGGAVRLETFADQGWGARTERSDDGIALVTIPDLVASVPNGRLLIAKIDIEGFESDLFAENIDWVDEAAAIFIEPHDWMLPGGGTSQSFQRALLGRGREILIAGENLVFI